MNEIRPTLAAVAIAVLLAMAGPSRAADIKASRFYEDALTRFENKDVAGAIVQLKNALQIDKTMLPVHMLLGKALLAQGDAVGAEIELTEALRLGVNRAEVVLPLARALIAQGRLRTVVDDPQFAPEGLPAGLVAQVLLLRASALADLGDSRRALRAIADARAIDPGNPATWLAEVPVRIRGREFREARAAADKALAIAPGSAEGLYLLGTVAHVQGDLNAALANYDRALRILPTHTEALVSRAGALIDQGRMPEAARDVAELLRSSPADPRGFYLKALLAERAGDAAATKTALNNITSLLDPVPIAFLRYRPQALMLGGLAHYGLNEREKAKPYLEAAQRDQPQSGVSKLLAQIYLANNDVGRAVESLEAYLKGQPGDTQALLLLASARMSQGRNALATQLMEDALRNQDRPELRTMLGMSLLSSGKFADATSALEAAVQKDPGQLQAGIALATLYLQGGQAAKALATAQALVQQHPTASGLQNLLGLARLRTGDAAGARAAFEAAARLEPAFAEPQIHLARLDIEAQAYDRARDRLNGLLAKDDKNVAALGELGVLAERQGRTKDARRWLEKAEDLSGPTNLRPGLALVDFLLRQGEPAAAQEAVRRLSTKAPEAAPVLVAVARVSMANGDAATARTSLGRAAIQAGYNAVPLLQIALLQVSAADLRGAAYTLAKALSNQPDFLPALALLAEVEIRQGELSTAEQHVRQIVASHPRAGIGQSLQGDLAAARGQKAAAIDAYRRAQQIEPSSAGVLRLHAALQQTDARAAQQVADQWIKTHPGDVAVLRAVADGQARAGNLSAARSAYEALLKVTPTDAEALNNLANVMLLTKDPGALNVAEQALRSNPNAAHIIGTTGWAAFKAGQPERALQLLRDARLRDPANPETRYFLGAVLASAGHPTEAREELEAALHSGPFADAPEAEKLLRSLK